MDETRGPSRAFLDARELAETIGRESAILDSRLNFNCFKLGRDPAPCREALADGRTVTFVTKRAGRRVTVHRIHPEELL